MWNIKLRTSWSQTKTISRQWLVAWIFLKSIWANLRQLLCLFLILDSEEYFDDSDVDDVDDVDGGEFTPLTHGIDDGLIVGVRNDVPNKNPDRRRVPAGYYPQWPTYYPEVVYLVTWYPLFLFHCYLSWFQTVDPNHVPSFNLYQHKKSMAQGMLDLALLSANANQLRYVLDSNQRNHYFYVSLTLISISLVLQVLVAMALVFKSRYNIDNADEMDSADRINNFIMIGILLITISNVVSSAFAPT